MPFTPLHMGVGIFIKALLQSSFSLMIFGWAQIIMDIQPLIVMITGEGHLHGFSHTYIGATLLAVFSAISGKHFSEWGLLFLGISKKDNPINIRWKIVFVSAFIGTISHVLLDSVMHFDVEPFFPFTLENTLYGLLTIEQIHKLCLYSGLIGAGLYYFIQFINDKKMHKTSS